ncbi:hydrogenase maturation protease [Leptolyngbya cf. ectocarpi LEGE 11479]|uniref:Hydrogenase maturation protease n=1 Tax=Leptolyngbya cf. ectocarpi LEGE 11479 TaxID=1828722 RepID=A0A928ZXB6_LEPEC|nr:hydrogenase maturation protease [Leptolyngbya ectocarpi]MBE9069162.1 hydrogenase maturation protease [Leptolyngbya cf. ectocarpi LEGE 11479]
MLPSTQISPPITRRTSSLTSPRTSAQAPTTAEYDFLIIGYGNELCGDAAVGPWVAMSVADWQLPAVKSVAVPQLIPELTAELAQTNYVMFVDACGHNRIRTVQIAPIVVCEQPPSRAFAAHTYDPLSLLNLTQRLYHRYPQAWLLQIPIESCDLGGDLSSKAHQGCDRALRSIEQFLITYRRPVFGERYGHNASV